jgi:sugar/nucleoside kinase (ribokinase family)
MSDRNAPRAHDPGAAQAVCLGEVAWDLRGPEGAPLEEGPPLYPAPGGGAVTTALELARLGVPTGLAAAVGDDLLGHALRRRLEAAGVDTRLLVASPAIRTGLVILASNAEGARRFLSYRSPDAEARALRAALPRDLAARALHLSALLPSPAPRRLFRSAIRAARGATLSLDVNARPRFWRGAKSSDRLAALELLQRFDWIKASEGDLEVLQITPADLLAKMSPTAALIVTRGTHPIRAFGPFGSIERSIEAPVDADPTGAGDAFCAGLVAELHQFVGAQTKRKPIAIDAVARAVDRGIEAARAFLARRVR